MKRTGPLKRTTPLRGKPKPVAVPEQRSAKRKTPRYTGPTKKMRAAVLSRDDATCQVCGRDIVPPYYSLQHRLPRGRGGKNTMCNLVTVCGDATTPGMCHDEIENQARKWATREGWLVPSGPLITPETWPVLRFRDHWAMPGEPDENGQNGWVECEPHPLQIEMGRAA